MWRCNNDITHSDMKNKNIYRMAVSKAARLYRFPYEAVPKFRSTLSNSGIVIIHFLPRYKFGLLATERDRISPKPTNFLIIQKNSRIFQDQRWSKHSESTITWQNIVALRTVTYYLMRGLARSQIPLAFPRFLFKKKQKVYPIYYLRVSIAHAIVRKTILILVLN